MNLFLLKIHPELRHYEFGVTLTAICEATGTINWIIQKEIKCNNLLLIIGESCNHL